MDWATIATLAGYVVFYAIGKGIGRAEGRRGKVPHIVLILELEGDAIGGVHLAGMRPGGIPESRLTGPPPGHPDHVDPTDPT